MDEIVPFDVATSGAGGLKISPALQAQRDREALALQENERQVARGEPSRFPSTASVVSGTKPPPQEGELISLDVATGGAATPESGGPGRLGDIAKSNVSNLAALTDMVLSVPAMGIGVLGDIGARMAGVAAGLPRREVSQAGLEKGQELTEYWGSPIRKAMHLFGYGEAYDKSDVTNALTVVSGWIDKGADWIEQHTRGAILKEDAQSLINELMAAGGAKGVGKVADTFVKSRVEAVKAKSADVSSRQIFEDETPKAAEPPPPKPRIKLKSDAFKKPEEFAKAVEEQHAGDLTKPSLAEVAGRPSTQAAAALATAGLTAALVPEDKEAIGLTGVALAGAIKGKGGMWHPEAVERLAQPLATSMRRAAAPAENMMAALEGRPEPIKEPHVEWANSRIKTYLNKHAGTATDPLKDVRIPMLGEDITWEKAWDNSIGRAPVEALSEVHRRWKPFPGSEKVPQGEFIYNVDEFTGGAGRGSYPAITSYLSHVGDYLREFVPPEKLQQYDLVRAVRETAAQDAKQAAKMAKARASGEGTTVYKEYPDGMKWVEVGTTAAKLPDNFKLVQEKDGTWGIYKDGEKIPEVGEDYPGEGEDLTKITDREYAEYVAKRIVAEQALKNEGDVMGHCVGGYCEAVHEGSSKIYSLRDKKGMSHVTVEVAPEGLYAAGPGGPGGPDIIQIKGKQNRAPVEAYLPYVQDFVKSGKWGEVGDLENAGLQDLNQARYQGTVYQQVRNELAPGKRFVTEEELSRLSVEVEKRVGSKGQRGSADPKLLTKLAAIGIGGTIGAQVDPDHPIAGAILGALAPTVGLSVTKRAATATFDAARAAVEGKSVKAGLRELVPGPISRAMAEDTRPRIKAEMDAAEVMVRRDDLERHRLVRSVVDTVPDKARREAISHWLEGDKTIPLTPMEHKAALRVREFFDKKGVEGLNRGVLRDLLDDYVTHVFGRKTRGLIDQMMAERSSGATTTPFAKQRRGPPTIAEVNTWMSSKGLPPITSDIAVIAETYGRSLSKAMANKSVIDALKQRVVKMDIGGKAVDKPLIMSAGKAPPNYRQFGKPFLVAHPDIIPALRFMFSHDDPNVIMRAIEGVNTASKRSLVSFSMFHAKALIDALAGGARAHPGAIAGGAALGAVAGSTDDKLLPYTMIGVGLGFLAPGVKHIAQAAAPKVFGENPYVRALRDGDPAMAKMIDLSIKGGLMYSLEKGALAVEDVGQSFYGMLEHAQRGLDRAIPFGGKPIEGLIKLNHAVDGFMWDRLHTGLKLGVFAEKYEVLMENNAKAHAANKAVPLLSETQIAERAASYTNDIFGGLNWRRVAEEASTRWGRDLAQALYSPKGRRTMQLLMFAPDWTLSTTRAAIKAFLGESTGIKGVLKPQTVADLHTQYMLRSGAYYFLVGDGLNYALTGHHLWDNKDPTVVELGDGRVMQWSKHTMEPYHWLMKPGQQALNKMGVVPRELATQALHKEYLTTGRMPEMRSRLGHLGRAVTPIGVQQAFEQGPQGQGYAGALGVPIYGKTLAERNREKERRRLELKLKALK